MFCYDTMEIRLYKEHLEEWHRITVRQEVEAAMKRSTQIKTTDMEGSDELSWEDVLKYNDLSNDTFSLVDKNNLKNISLSSADHRDLEQEDMSEDISVDINQDCIPLSKMNSQMWISSSLSRSHVTLTQMTNIIRSPSCNISTELTSRYTCNTTEHVLLDSHTDYDTTAGLLHINMTPNILERAFTLPMVSQVATKIASVTSPLQPCVKKTLDTGSYVAGGVKSIIHCTAPSIPGSATAANLSQAMFGRATTALVQLDTLACSGFDYLVTWINNRDKNTDHEFTQDDENGTNHDKEKVVLVTYLTSSTTISPSTTNISPKIIPLCPEASSFCLNNPMAVPMAVPRDFTASQRMVVPDINFVEE